MRLITLYVAIREECAGVCPTEAKVDEALEMLADRANHRGLGPHVQQRVYWEPHPRPHFDPSPYIFSVYRDYMVEE